MNILLYSKVLKKSNHEAVQHIFDVLKELGMTTYVFTPFLDQVKQSLSPQQACLPFDGYVDFENVKIDCVLSLGGDGTILGAVTVVRDTGVPIMGINLGRMGFLANIEKKNIDNALLNLYHRKFTLDKRTLLYLDSNLPLFGQTPFALNDCTILKRDTSSMIQIKAFINGELLNTYWADGLIIATPTGSTGYSLSCGGPVIYPNASTLIITPVAPHNLSTRPIIVPDDSVISLEISGRENMYICTLDSRLERITETHTIAIKKCDFKINMVKFSGQTFNKTLRDKLTWGIDPRN